MTHWVQVIGSNRGECLLNLKGIWSDEVIWYHRGSAYHSLAFTGIGMLRMISMICFVKGAGEVIEAEKTLRKPMISSDRKVFFHCSRFSSFYSGLHMLQN